MKIQITIFLILSTLINLSNTNAQTVSIENNLLTLRIHKQQITIENKKLPDLKVKNILLPGQIIASEKTETSDRLWGEGQSLETHYNDGRKVTFTLYGNNPFLYIRTVMKNRSGQDVRVSRLEIASVEMSIGEMNQPLNTLGSGGFAPVQQAQGSYTYTLLAEPDSRHSILSAWLTQKQGIGVMTPKLDRGL